MTWAASSFVRRTVLALGVCAVLAAVLPASAFALTLAASANALDKTDVSVSLAAPDQPGLVLLYLDGALIRSSAATRVPFTASFKAVPLKVGPHHLSAVLRAAGGLTETSARDIVSWRKPVPPVFVSPTAVYAGKTVPVIAKAGPGTTALRLIVNGRAITSKNASPGQLIGFGSVALGAGMNTIVVEGYNPVAKAAGVYHIRRLDFPWPTCIVIDKSDFKLYWVRDGILVKTYPVAIGKSSSETPERNWRVGEKYVYEYWGIYGPRRLRLYKQSGNSFYYSAYGVHGTNQEWVIGTKASHGCIRMYNKDILELYPQVPLYTMVQTRE